MAFEEIFDSIEVIAHFQNGKINPLKFLWNGRTYQIKRVNNHWREPLGNADLIHFSVHASDGNCFELIFDNSDYSWQLANVYLEG